MMNTVRLVLDANYLCHRAFHTPGRGKLAFKDRPTGVVYGFLQDLKNLLRDFQTKEVVFCWDMGKPLRAEIFPAYKANRVHNSAVIEQAELLQHEIIPRLGFSNNFAKAGYEADDVIAAVVRQGEADNGVTDVIVSADQDLWQLLMKDNTECWNPQQKRMMTEPLFTEKYKIGPEWWPEVKAVAGCVSDNIKGVPGIGQVTALKYFQNTRSVSTRACKKIEEYEWRSNLKLTKLPLDGIGTPNLKDDEFDPEAWAALCHEYGMRSLGELM